MELSDAEILMIQDRAALGKRMEEMWLVYGEMLDKNLFEPLEVAAFETFKKVNATDTNAIIETQIMSKMLAKIRSRINQIISEGYEASQILEYSTEKGG